MSGLVRNSRRHVLLCRGSYNLLVLQGVLRHWLDAGADGFFVKDVQRLVEGNVSLSESMVGEHTVDQPENLELVKRWRNILNSFSDKPGRER